MNEKPRWAVGDTGACQPHGIGGKLPFMERSSPPAVVRRIIVCQGPPRCELGECQAIEAIQTECSACRRITVYQDGSEAEAA